MKSISGYVKFFLLTKRVMSFLGLLFNCLLFAYCVFGYKYSADLDLNVTGYYVLFPVCLGVFLFFFSMNMFFDWANFTDFKLAFVALIVLLCLGYLQEWHFLVLGMEQVLCLFSFLIGGYVFLFFVRITEYDAFFHFVNLVTVLQLIRAFEQVFALPGFYVAGSTVVGSLEVVGYFGNSGALAVYLVVVFPFLFFSVRSLALRWRVFLLGLAAVAVLVVLVVTLSRTSILCFILELLVLVMARCLRRFYRRFKWGFWLGCIGLLAGLGVLLRVLFLMKLRSAEGRLLIWEVCFSWIRKSPVCGYGLGSFSFWYPLWQSDYFASHARVPTAYFMSAGETIVAFNEYVQVLCELGFVGLVLLVLSLVLAFCAGFTFVGAKRLLFLKVFLFGCCAAAFSFYVFHCNAIGFLFVLVLLLLVYRPEFDHYRFMRPVVRLPLFIVVAVVVGFTVLKSGSRASAVREFERVCLRHDLSDGELKRVVGEVHPVLCSDGKFLTRLGLLMLEYDQKDQAAGFLERSRDFYTGYENYLELAKCSAVPVGLYRFLAFYVPSRFTAKYGLFCWYRSSGQVLNADRMGVYMMQMPVKFSSAGVLEIKREVERYLELRGIRY